MQGFANIVSKPQCWTFSLYKKKAKTIHQSALLLWQMSSDDANSADRYQINLHMMQPGFVPASNKDEIRAEEMSGCDNKAKFCCSAFLSQEGEGEFLTISFSISRLTAELYKVPLSES